MLEKVKTAMRITSNALDADITDNIEAAKLDLIRSGVSADVIETENNLVVNAIKIYCLMFFALSKGETDRYDCYVKAYECSLDNLRKSVGYGND